MGLVETYFAVYFGVIIGYLVLYSLTRFYVVEAGTAMVVERWGRFHRRCDAGLHYLIPFIDKPRPIVWRHTEVYLERHTNKQQSTVTQTQEERISLLEGVLDFSNQPIITRDNVLISVHPVLFYKLIDPVRVAYETYDLPACITTLVQTTLRSIIGDMCLDDCLSSRAEIERGLRVRIKSIALNWGLDLISVELLEITPTHTVISAMHTQVSAERVRRANVVEAEGYRQQKKTEAEGMAAAMVARATGQAQVDKIIARGKADARRVVANAEAQALRVLAGALGDYGVDPTSYSVALKYLDAFVKLATSASRRLVFLPMETDIVGSAADLRVEA